MKLTKNDYKEIASMLEEGANQLEYNNGTESLSIDIQVMYDEDGIQLYTERAVSWDEDGNETENDYSEFALWLEAA